MIDSDVENPTRETVRSEAARQRLSLKAAEQEVPELPAIKQLLTLLDKTFKTARTYGPNNPVAQRFFQQFYDDLSGHLTTHHTLLFLVQRSELYYKGHAVYQAPSPTENLAFKLHADGIRELAFNKGLSQGDLAFFLEALWATSDQEDSDEDIVTRLWDKNLSTISFMTAEEIIKSSDFVTVLTPQDSQRFNTPISNLPQVKSSETRKPNEEGTGTGAGGQGGAAVAGYEISAQELGKLAQEIEAESSRDNVTYVLDMLTAVLASERSTVILSKLLDIFSEILDALAKQGNWKLLNTIVSLLHESPDLCPNLSEEHRRKLSTLFEGIESPERLRAMENALNASPDSTALDDLHALLLMFKPTAIQPLCLLMANLKHKPHRLMVCEALTTLAKQNPSSLLKGLNDSRWYYVRNLVYIMGKLNSPQQAKYLEPLIIHQDARVRKEVLRTLRILSPTGAGNQFILFLNDQEESIRLYALKILTSGQYSAEFQLWSPVVTSKSFEDRSISEKRAAFHAMRLTSGEEMIPFCHRLVTQWCWSHRKQAQEGALLAAEALGKLATPSAIIALQTGAKRINRAIRKACTEALAATPKPQNVANP